MQKELSDKLDIAKSNVASWLARGQVPGNVIVQCALDTGVDVNWLVPGGLEKASFHPRISNISGKAVYDEVMVNGGKPVLRRIWMRMDLRYKSNSASSWRSHQVRSALGLEEIIFLVM